MRGEFLLLGLTLLFSADAALVGVCQTTSPARELYMFSLDHIAPPLPRRLLIPTNSFADPGVATFWMASNTQDPFVPGKLTRGSVHLVSESGVQVGNQFHRSQPILAWTDSNLTNLLIGRIDGLRSRQLVRG
jgi:hypothetical protein